MTHISEMNLIRVLVKSNKGDGHVRSAITLMLKLREIGFTGILNICANENTFNILEKMIPQFKLINDQNKHKMMPDLGKISISVFSASTNSTSFKERADLTVCAAGTSDFKHIGARSVFNAQSYINLQPTDYCEASYVVDKYQSVRGILKGCRLFSASIHQQLDTIDSIKKSDVEKKILTIIKQEKCNSQIVYGMYHENNSSRLSVLINNLIEAHKNLNKNTDKPTLLLVPKYFIYTTFINNIDAHYIDFENNKHIDIKKYKTDDIIVAYTGFLQYKIFDYLLLKGTTLPPIIEGAHSREFCECAGRPFVVMDETSIKFKEYNVELTKMQELHKNATKSCCGHEENIADLVQYMKKSLDPNSKLHTYHKQRQEQYLARPDGIQIALDALSIGYNKNIEQNISTSISNVTSAKTNENLTCKIL